MIRIYSQMHHTNKYSQHSLIISTIWLNGWLFVFELSGCRFESCCSQVTWHLLNQSFELYRVYQTHFPDSLTLVCIKWFPQDLSTTFLVTSSTWKMPECSDSMNSSIFMPENMISFYLKWTEFTRNFEFCSNFVWVPKD